MATATFEMPYDASIEDLKANTGIVENGNTATNNIDAGKYVNWNGKLYTADSAISIGDTLADSGEGKNLTVCPDGGFNALNSKIISNDIKTNNVSSGYIKLYKSGKICTLVFHEMTLASTLASGSGVKVGEIPSGSRPSVNIGVPCAHIVSGSYSSGVITINANGDLSFTNLASVGSKAYMDFTMSYIID